MTFSTVAGQEISRFVVGSGGTAATDGSTGVRATIGQVATGRASIAGSTLRQGFWYGLAALISSDVHGSFSTENPDGLHLQVAPNPISGTAYFRMTIPVTTDITLKLYDHLGRLVAIPVDGEYTSGERTIKVDLASLDTGGYRAVLTAGDERTTLSLIVIR